VFIFFWVYRETKKKVFDSTTIKRSPKSNLWIDHIQLCNKISLTFKLRGLQPLSSSTTQETSRVQPYRLKNREIEKSKVCFLADCYQHSSILLPILRWGGGRKRESILSSASPRRSLRFVGLIYVNSRRVRPLASTFSKAKSPELYLKFRPQRKKANRR